MTITIAQHAEFLTRMHTAIEEAGYTIPQVAEHLGYSEHQLRTPVLSDENPDGLSVDDVYRISRLVDGEMVEWFRALFD
ncbi:hypothetical protein CBI38_24710 [Rhodococcus oxybenzonivorans]|uniref:XRE family transcriptional regulator n=1 Tax=Rhodococcus oxybenzonivorans TaxID=1990687 RepID=A0A2S2C088_9NOCA|nr:hypothetical protein [Rhodococcus oxybenzonivorans]AWK74280.1 hypothetical protein CBI38_24710 [Rhodococcus oxybenzonivorans]